MTQKTINLALQGGGAHGAFTWGALDRLLDDERIDIEGITATSAGAMNAAALKGGWVRDGRAGAKAALQSFWEEISAGSVMPNPMLQSWLAAATPAPEIFSKIVEMSPGYLTLDTLSRLFSPYEINPLNVHPLKPLVTELLNFEDVCADVGPQLFISATNVRSGKVKVFGGADVTPDVLLASACLPTLYQAVEIKDPETGTLEAYWDGGFMGNPALFPLFYQTSSRDVMIIHINPIYRETLPQSATEILNRINEISFNSSLLRELRSIDFVQRLMEMGKVREGSMKSVLIHSIMDDELMTQLSAATKLTPNRALLLQLKAAGHRQMDEFLKNHFDDLNTTSTVDLRKMFD